MLKAPLTKNDEITIATALRVSLIQIKDGRQTGTRKQKAEWIRDIEDALAKIDVTR
jgi:hypothetical protein